MTTPILVTKLYIPPFRPELLPRLNLIEKLNAGLDRVLTIISAPAGYGKTTLLSEWVSQIDIPVAWVSLEKGENIPARFWSYFITALHTIPHLHQAGIGESIFQALQSSQSPPMDALLTSLANDFSEFKERAILVLDDLHTITESQIHQDLVYLIDHLPLSPNGLQLVVASRMDPPWPLARWRVRNALNELRPADLRFSYDETVQFLNQSLHLKLSLQDVSALQDRTEGWIAGLQMAAVSMQGRLKAQGSGGVSRFIETFTGSNRFILDYLMEEVISQQPAEMQDFLHETSILEQLTAPLCDALTGRQDGQTMLEQVERANLFLIALDDERKWYRYHHLFVELLRKRLKQMMPDHITELHRRASEWYAEQTFLSEAVSHAINAGDFPRVNELVSGNVFAIGEHAELLDVLRHFEEMPDQFIAAKPWLGVAYAWVKTFANPSGDVERILQKTEQSLVGVENVLESQRLMSYLNAIRAYVAWVKGEDNRALEFTRRAMKNLSEDDRMLHAHLLNIEGLVMQSLFNLSAAIQSYKAAIVVGQNAGGTFNSLFNSNLASTYLVQGRLNLAFSHCQQVLRLVNESAQVSKSIPVLAHPYGIMSMVQLERNNLESAVLFARESVALAEMWNQADTLQFALACLSQAWCASGDLEQAVAVNQRAMQLAVHVSPWYFRVSACNEILLNLEKGNIPAATHRFTEIEPLMEERDKKGRFLFTKISLLYAQGLFSDVISAVQEPVRDLEDKGIYWHLLNLMPFQALSLQALGREEEAVAVTGHCLALAASEGYSRIFLARGTPMHKLLQIALSRGIATEYINMLLPAFDTPDASKASEASDSAKARSKLQNANLIEPLSKREFQVLCFLNTHLSIPEIAREMVIAPSTIRTHVRNIYNKLDVHGRIEAVQKAKDSGLI